METPCAVTDMKYWPGVPTLAPRGLRTHICQLPRIAAMTKAAMATQKCARQSRSLLRTGNPPVGTRLELFLAQHPDPRPHLTVPQAAELVAGHQQVAGAGELGVNLRHIAGDYHGVDVGPGNQKSVDHVR